MTAQQSNRARSIGRASILLGVFVVSFIAAGCGTDVGTRTTATTSTVANSTVVLGKTVVPQKLNCNISTWEWRLDWRQPGYATQLDALANQGFNRIYVEISDLGAKTPPPTLAGEINSFQALATIRGIATDGLVGDPSWITDTDAPLKILNFVKKRNAASPTTPIGVQYDVEPWGLPAWSENKEKLTIQYLDFVRTMISNAGSTAIGFAIPVWFDSTNAVPKVSWNNRSATPFDHLLNILSGSQHELVIMNYTNKVSPLGGGIGRGKPLLKKAENARVKLTMAVDTSKADPGSSTYYNKADSFMKDLPLLRSAFTPYKTFSGMAVHDVASLSNLTNKVLVNRDTPCA